MRAYRPESAEVDVDFFLHGDIGRADGAGQVWGGCEALAMRSVRDIPRAAGVPRSAMDVLAYWKHRSTPEDVEY